MNIIIENLKQLVPVNGQNQLGCISNASIVIEKGIIQWIGPAATLPSLWKESNFPRLQGHAFIAFPGFIDCHTHLVFGGDRAHEFGQRIAGKSYQQIAQEGGGILSTVNATRQSSNQELLQSTQKRLKRMLEFGITTLEIKSGYGLSLEHELRLLEIINQLNQNSPLDIIATFLGAHQVPLEFKNNPNGYIQLLIQEMIPEVSRQKLATFCDVFCEAHVFDLQQARQILESAQRYQLKLKIHAEQLSASGAAVMAAKLGAVSADHLTHLSEAEIEILATSSTAAVLLPGAELFLRSKIYPPALQLLKAKIPVAISTDCNPGSCMSENLPLMGTLAALQMGLSPAQVIEGITIHAAQALDLKSTHGSLEIGKKGDVALLDLPHWESLPYHFGVNHVVAVIKNGQLIHKIPSALSLTH